jgi:hypothetical protein
MRMFWAMMYGSLLTGGGCTSDTLEFEDANVGTIESLARLGRSGHFPQSIRANEAGLDLFYEVASTHFDPRVVAAGLDALTHHLWQGTLDAHEDRLVPLMHERLAAETDLVVDRALDLSEVYLTRGGRSEVADDVAGIVQSHDHSGARVRAVQVLARHEGWAQSPEHVSAMVKATRDVHPWVAAEALQRLGWSAGDVLDPRAVLGVILQGVEHPQPSVRGRALRAAAQYAPDDPWVQAMQRGSLYDASPYVRAEALRSVGDALDLRALSRVVELTGDPESDVLRLSGWTYLDGREGVMRLGVSRSGQLSDVALDALVALTESMATGFDRQPLDPENIHGSLMNEGERASSWYRGHLDVHRGEASH